MPEHETATKELLHLKSDTLQDASTPVDGSMPFWNDSTSMDHTPMPRSPLPASCGRKGRQHLGTVTKAVHLHREFITETPSSEFPVWPHSISDILLLKQNSRCNDTFIVQRSASFWRTFTSLPTRKTQGARFQAKHTSDHKSYDMVSPKRTWDKWMVMNVGSVTPEIAMLSYP